MDQWSVCYSSSSVEQVRSPFMSEVISLMMEGKSKSELNVKE